MSQMDSNHSGHAHYHQYHNRKRHFSGNVGRGREVEKDVLTGEARQYTGPPSVSSFSPNHPSHHHSGHNHYGNVELIGHQPLVASRSYGYSTLSQYETGTTTQGQVPCSRIGMGPTDSSSSEMEEGRIEWETLPPTEHKRQKVLQSLMETESTFHSVLQNGIETYLEPLRSVLSGSIHSKLFYNLKELCDVATRVESQLKKRRLPYVGGATKETTPYFITHIADIYHSELPELMTLLKGYLDNLHSAKQELSLAFTNEAFTHLVQKCVLEGKNKSIYAFIEAGKDYVSRLFKALLGAYYYTSSTDVDQTYLSTALRQLARICPDKDTVTKWEEEQRIMQRLEVCVSFGPKIPRIPIVVPGRVLVKEGEALLIENKGKTKVWVILFSDIVLLTQRHRGTVLMCLEPAIPLASLRVDDFNCTEDTEFQISNTEGSLIRLLRFPTISDKSDWMASLKERATGSFKRQHGERQSRVNNLPKLQNPADLLPPPPPPPHPPGPVEGDGRNKRSHSPEGAGRVATGGRPLSQWCDPSSTTKSHEFGTAGRGVKRLSQQFEHPDLGLSAANPPGWKRSTARRSFNLFGGKGKEKKRKKSELLSPNSQTPSLSFSEDNLTFYDIPPETLRLWKKSLDNVLADQAGRVLFQRHLCSEHSTENWEFCEEVDRFKTLPENKLAKEAKSIAATYIGDGTPKAVNIDAKVANSVKAEMKHPHRDMFDKARDAAYELMSEDTFRRFTMSQDFQKASTRDRQSPQPPMATS